ncbi:Protein of unknown function [Lactobacillus hominis DSM 23910 = CRBIP 24.179]|uniref:Uncharacterized protein n=1 Tax=Lactobacillus hominis DSM 23910 = CRBIP 24.179 TaxID=1423758 RepID=I7IVI6_9LACO|nr:Protein of unknown function [Lactobacillus hominis DSM 23910 = CRBIP 24.179]
MAQNYIKTLRQKVGHEPITLMATIHLLIKGEGIHE